LTVAEIDAALMSYCQRNHIDPRQAGNVWLQRRHPQLVRLHTMRALILQGRAAELPRNLLAVELKPATFDQRRRASARARAERDSYRIREL
jgi:hypothetical protein